MKPASPPDSGVRFVAETNHAAAPAPLDIEQPTAGASAVTDTPAAVPDRLPNGVPNRIPGDVAPSGGPRQCAFVATGRLRLREFVATDRAALVDMHRDPRVREWLVDDVPLDDARLAALFIERMRHYYRAHPGLGIWCAERWHAALSADELADPAVREALSDEALAELARPRPHFAGWFNLMRVTDRPDEVEIGCRLRPEAWGSGLVHDGGEALLAHAFERLRLPRVWGICHPRHRSVHHVLRTLGFRLDGDRPCAGTAARWYLIDAADWPAVAAMPRRQRLRRAFAAAAGEGARDEPRSAS